jgi:hypothetical protein
MFAVTNTENTRFSRRHYVALLVPNMEDHPMMRATLLVNDEGDEIGPMYPEDLFGTISGILRERDASQRAEIIDFLAIPLQERIETRRTQLEDEEDDDGRLLTFTQQMNTLNSYETDIGATYRDFQARLRERYILPTQEEIFETYRDNLAAGIRRGLDGTINFDNIFLTGEHYRAGINFIIVSE